jgi:nucleotide-binding universal stress UspA family protein
MPGTCPGGRIKMIKNILVAFDGSPKSYEAFEFALDMASMCKSVPFFFVLSVIQPPESLYFAEMSDVVAFTTREYESLFRELEKKARARDMAIRTKTLVGHPADKIVKFAREKRCDMIVMGQRGKSAIKGLLLGSVSRRVASAAHCTVTIVK